MYQLAQRTLEQFKPFFKLFNVFYANTVVASRMTTVLKLSPSSRKVNFLGFPWQKIAKQRCINWGRGDSMIWNFTGRRPLPVRDYVLSIEGGPMS